MSGGYFDHQQYRLGQMADEIEDAIYKNNRKDEDEYCTEYSEETIVEFKDAIKALRVAQVYVHEIDYLLSGDTGEESFHKKLNRKLNVLNNTVSNLDNT